MQLMLAIYLSYNGCQKINRFLILSLKFNENISLKHYATFFGNDNTYKLYVLNVIKKNPFFVLS